MNPAMLPFLSWRVVAVLAMCLLPLAEGEARSGGITGHSEAGCGGSACHSGGGGFDYRLPALVGSTTIDAASVGNIYTLEFERGSGGAAANAGFNLSTTSGTLVDPDVGDNPVEADAGELTHSTPATAADDKFSWSFSFDAPGSPKAVKFFVCANPVNRNFANTGDGPWRCTTFDISVVSGDPASPVASNDDYNTPRDTVLTVSAAQGVLANDNDANGDPLTAVLDQDAASGSVVLASDGSFTYTPLAGFVGQDSFAYHANDGVDDSDPATVKLEVAREKRGDGGGAFAPLLMLVVAIARALFQFPRSGVRFGS